MALERTIDLEAEKKLITKEYRSLLRLLGTGISKTDKENIRLAFEMALDAHKDMRRKSGEPYILHPLAVAKIVAGEIGLGPTAVVCALLHDVVEDTEITLEDMERSFDKQVARIIDGLTKISGVFDLRSSVQAENFRKLLLTMTDDIRVILIKMADRLHNMRTLDSMPRHKQLKISSETSFLYAPLAHRLGLYAIKSEMEDLVMKYTEPELYREIAVKLAEKKRERSRYINEFIKPLKGLLGEKGFKFDMYGRPKSIHSIANKMRNKGVTFEEVYDLFAIRVILDSPMDQEKSDCWNVYSAITDIYRPNPDRLRDWISNPKANGYEALHTTVMGPKGRWVEVQIRSERMHDIAERGLAAHWKYKETVSDDSALDDWLERIQQILSNPEANTLDFISDFKLDLFSDEIFVFTPNGDLKRLRNGATALDFGFEIHTEVGLRSIGAKVNHKLVPLSHVLDSGDQVELLTSKRQKPNEDWLNFVVTAKARTNIKQALKEEKRLIADDGKAMLERRFRRRKIAFNNSNIQTLCSIYDLQNQQELFYRIATNRISLDELKNLEVIGNKIRKPRPTPQIEKVDDIIERKVREELKENAELMIMGESADSIQYSFAKCCNPIPGDDVFGFLLATGGVKIHRTTCPNAANLMGKYHYRVVKTRWNREHEIAFLTSLEIAGIDDVGLISKVTDVISRQMNINMQSLSIDSKDGIFEGNIKVYVHDTGQLEELIEKLKGLEGVLNINRYDIEESEDNPT